MLRPFDARASCHGLIIKKAKPRLRYRPSINKKALVLSLFSQEVKVILLVSDGSEDFGSSFFARARLSRRLNEIDGCYSEPNLSRSWWNSGSAIKCDSFSSVAKLSCDAAGRLESKASLIEVRSLQFPALTLPSTMHLAIEPLRVRIGKGRVAAIAMVGNRMWQKRVLVLLLKMH